MSTFEIIKKLCKNAGITVAELEKELGFGNGSMSKCTNNMKSDRLLIIAKYFHVSMEYLMGAENIEYDPESHTWDIGGYYTDDEAKEYAQFLFENPEYRVLFDASRKVKKEDLEKAVIALGLFRGNDNN